MPDTAPAGLTALTGAGAAVGDLVVVTDVSATADKKMTLAELILGLHALGVFTLAGGVNVALATSTGTQIGTAANQLLAFHGATATDQCAAYTQTYATADRTHANPTAATLTVTDGAGTNDNTIGAITADASVIAAVQELADEINKLVADVADVKQIVNAVIDDLQEKGLVG